MILRLSGNAMNAAISGRVFVWHGDSRITPFIFVNHAKGSFPESPSFRPALAGYSIKHMEKPR